MDKKATAARLLALASDDAKRPKAAQLRDVYEEVEATLAAGVPQHEVVATLQQQGLNMTLATFQTTLKRIRDKRRHLPTTTVPITAPRHQPAAPAHASREPEPPLPADSSHKPSAIDSIMQSKPDLHALSKLGKRSRK